MKKLLGVWVGTFLVASIGFSLVAAWVYGYRTVWETLNFGPLFVAGIVTAAITFLVAYGFAEEAKKRKKKGRDT
jgi:hypothetical protein